MKKIYVGHSSKHDFKKEIYEPIRNSKLNSKYNFILPHENSDKPFNSKEELKSCKLMIAEISYPSVSLGIEVGWANSYNVPVIFIYKKGSKVSPSLKVVSSNFIEYENPEEFLEKIEEVLEHITSSK